MAKPVGDAPCLRVGMKRSLYLDDVANPTLPSAFPLRRTNAMCAIDSAEAKDKFPRMMNVAREAHHRYYRL